MNMMYNIYIYMYILWNIGVNMNEWMNEWKQIWMFIIFFFLASEEWLSLLVLLQKNEWYTCLSICLFVCLFNEWIICYWNLICFGVYIYIYMIGLLLFFTNYQILV